jgi:glucose-1-phosphate thymidylyltransferase
VKGLLLAGGHGTRLRPLTFSGNKHMLPIANQPILFYGLKHFARAGIRDVGIVLGPIQEGIRESIGDGSALGLRVHYIDQGPPKGLAHAVLCAREYLGEDPFVMYLGDNLLQEGVEAFVRLYEDQHPDAVVGATPVTNPSQYGIIELDGERIVSIEEKPAHPRSDLALIGVYLFDPSIHSVIADLKPSKRGELEITDAIWRLHDLRHRVIARRVDGWWKDTGRPEDLLEANELVLRTYPSEELEHLGAVAAGAEVHGAVSIGQGSVVEAGARIEGPAILGSGVNVGRGTRIGPGTSIGNGVQLAQVAVRRSIIQDGARIEGPIHLVNSLIGRNVEIRFPSGDTREVSLTLGDSSRIVA